MNSDTLVDVVLDNAIKGFKRRETDFEEDGIIYCGKCGQPRQAWIDWIPDDEGNVTKRLVPVICRCDAEEERELRDREEEESFKTGIRRIRSVIDAAEAKWSFAQDENPNGKISSTLKRYVERWEEMRKENMGILLYGSKGTGKSFYASCLVNAMEEKRKSSAIVSTASIMSTMQSSWDKQEIIDALCKLQLLALDDLGAERDTSYSAELMYSVIDARYRSRKPTVVTTNISLEDMKTETDLWRSRIYDRIIEMCPITILMAGESRRGKLADERKQIARELLKGDA